MKNVGTYGSGQYSNSNRLAESGEATETEPNHSAASFMASLVTEDAGPIGSQSTIGDLSGGNRGTSA